MDGIIVFLNSQRGLAAIESLAANGYGITQVFLPPDHHLGKATASLCNALKVPFEEVADVNSKSFVSRFQSIPSQISVIGGFSTIFSPQLINVPKLGTINLHGGLLPQYRGGSPLNWQIINGEKDVGISVIRVNEEIDSGEILADGSFPLDNDETIVEAHERANALFPKLLLEVVERFDRGDFTGRKQDKKKATYWHQRNQADGRIRFGKMSAETVHNLVRAVTTPYPGAFAYWRERVVKIFKTRLPETVIRGVPGRVFRLQGQGPYVVCKDRAILVEAYSVDDDMDLNLPHGIHLI